MRIARVRVGFAVVRFGANARVPLCGSSGCRGSLCRRSRSGRSSPGRQPCRCGARPSRRTRRAGPSRAPARRRASRDRRPRGWSDGASRGERNEREEAPRPSRAEVWSPVHEIFPNADDVCHKQQLARSAHQTNIVTRHSRPTLLLRSNRASNVSTVSHHTGAPSTRVHNLFPLVYNFLPLVYNLLPVAPPMALCLAARSSSVGSVATTFPGFMMHLGSSARLILLCAST